MAERAITTTILPEDQQARLTDIFDQYASLTEQGLQTPGFEQVAGFDPLELEGQQNVLDFSRGAGQGLFEQGQQALQFGLGDVLSPESNPFLQQYGDLLSQSFADDFNERIAPAIRGGAVAAGQFGGSRQGIAEGLAAGKAAQAAAGARTQLYNAAYSRGLDTFDRSLAFTPELGAYGSSLGETIAGVGAQRRDLEQTQIDQDVNDFFFNQFAPFQLLQQYLDAVTGEFGGTTVADTGLGTGSGQVLPDVGPAEPVDPTAPIAPISDPLIPPELIPPPDFQG